MKNLTKVPRLHFFFRQAGVLQNCPICKQKGSISSNSADQLRYGVDDGSKLSFGSGFFFEGLRYSPSGALPVVTLCEQYFPAGNTTIQIARGEGARLKPAV